MTDASALAYPAAGQSSAEIGNALQRLERQADAAGHVNRAVSNSLGKVQSSVEKCLAELRKGGMNEEVAKILRGIARKPGQQYFNLSNEHVLAKLERAVGRKLNLSEFDLQTCVGAFDLYADLRAHTEPVRGGPGQSCPPNTNFCEGTVAGSFICCGGMNGTPKMLPFC